MHYENYGEFAVPVSDVGLVNRTLNARRDFWEEVNDQGRAGLADAVGCYVFGIRAGGGITPWYVGKTDNQSFERECFQADKINCYNDVLANYDRGTPVILLTARTTNNGRLCRPTRNEYEDVRALEKILIGLAYKKNWNICNVQGTRLLGDLVVPGIFNSDNRRITGPTRSLRLALGLT